MTSNTKNKRRGSKGGNSLSEPDLITAGKKEDRSGFPPGITVDELWLYRRKRPSANLWPSDNLKLREGSFKPLKTEYKRRFKNYYEFNSTGNIREDISPTRASKPEDHLKIEGSFEVRSLYKDNFIEYPIEIPLPRKSETRSFEIIDSNESEMKEKPSESERLLTEIKSKYIRHPVFERPPLAKRPTNLKLEGDLYTTTEKAEKFIEYLLSKRPSLLKKATTLKLEGDMDINTENREKYVSHQLPPRPPLYKKPTNLHLEGDLDILTEKQEKFVRYDYQKRPPLTKKLTNLHVEGELIFLPEYRKEFIEYNKAERPKLALPVNNLKTDGFYDVPTDVSPTYERQIHPQIPNLRTSGSHEDLALKARLSRSRENLLKLDGPMLTETESRTQFVAKSTSKTETPKIVNNLYLEGRIDLNPEYRNAYIDFNKNTVPLVRSRRARHENNLKTEGEMEISPEYKCSYVDFPRKRPQLRKPESHLSSQGEIDHMTEKKEKYVPFSNIPRTEAVKRGPELKLEGNIECQPEYRKAYIDYLIRERVERKPRPLDNLGQHSKRAIEDEPVIKTTLVNLKTPIEEKPPPSIRKEPPTPRKSAQEKRSARNRSLSQIENSLFGPKLQVPEDKRKSSSRSTTPDSTVSRSSRRRSRTLPRNQNFSNSSDSDIPPRNVQKTFDQRVLVENLASRSTTPVLPLINVSAKNKWMRDSSIESSSAFVVLDKNVKSAYNEKRKWTPNWNNSSSEY